MDKKGPFAAPASSDLLPESEVFSEDGLTVTYTFNISEIASNYDCIKFYTNHQFATAYCDGRLIYSLKSPDFTLFGRTPGSAINLVKFDKDATTLTIAIKAVYPSVAGRHYTFTVGDGIYLHSKVITGSIIACILSLLIVAIGFFLVLFWTIFHKKVNQGPTLLYFGCTVSLIGLWCLNETEFITLLYLNHTVTSFISYMLLLLVPVPFVQYIRKYFLLDDKVICATISLFSIADFCICFLGNTTGLLPFKNTAIITQCVFALSILYLIYAVMWYYRRFGFNKLVQLNVAAIILILIGFISDSVIFYIGLSNGDIVGKFCILIYIFLITRVIVWDFIAEIEKGKKAVVYQELAMHDVMTGLYNRTAFEEFEKSGADLTGTAVITFDLNNLKKCNDTLGHISGDKYLINAANIIESSFKDIGKSYRIGGDEFCSVISGVSEDRLKFYLQRFERYEQEYNKLKNEATMEIAYGYAYFNPETDTSPESTRERADKMMYQKKSEMKQDEKRE
ncbi:MAG: GGDEF domain-containing protein [Lachnospiraceae bacterium]|nr:GGDEF domain-containing protein [Lachnospiraceae bacterium]